MSLACKAGRERFMNASEATLLASKWNAEVTQYLIRFMAAVNSPKGKLHPLASGQQDLNTMFNPFLPPKPPKLTAAERKAELKKTAGLIFGAGKAELMAD